MKVNGITLIELLVTLAVVAILTTIAVPQYTAYRNKEIRTDAVRSMMKFAMELERCRSRNGDGTYTNCPNVNNTTTSQQRHYTITVALSNGDTRYTITAVKVGKVDPDCNSLSITHDGLRDASSSNSSLDSPKKRIQRCWAS